MMFEDIDSDNRIKVEFNREVLYYDIFEGEVIENGKSHNLTSLLDRREADKHFLVEFKQALYSPDLPDSGDDEFIFDWDIEMIDFKSFYIVVAFSHPELVS